MSDARIASLHIYPIKGCRGMPRATAEVVTTGLASEGIGDREWLVVDGAGQFVTQRDLPRLALVDVTAQADGLHLRAPHMRECIVPRAATGPLVETMVWHSAVRGRDAGDNAAQWLSDWLAHDVRLLRFDASFTRLCNPAFAGDSGAHTLFADGYPVLIIGSESLADLNARLAARDHPALPMNRFRPNIVLDGLPAYAEDHIDTFTIGSVILRAVKPCTRCTVTTTDQASARVGIEPLRTLGEYRMNEALEGVTFGMNAIVVSGGAIAQGDGVAVAYRF
jgi:uncharacterized protein YcbX